MGHIVIFGLILVVVGFIVYPLLNKATKKLKQFKEKVDNDQ